MPARFLRYTEEYPGKPGIGFTVYVAVDAIVRIQHRSTGSTIVMLRHDTKGRTVETYRDALESATLLAEQLQ